MNTNRPIRYVEWKIGPFLANVNSFAICSRPSVCLLSVVCLSRSCTLLTQFKFSAIFLRQVPWPSVDIHWNFHGDRPTSHIHGNDGADTAAKSALSLPITNMKLPARELIPCVSKFCLDEWQDIWDCFCEGNKLHSIYPTVGTVKHSKICSLRFRATQQTSNLSFSSITHSFLLYGDGPPTCQSCGTSLTVKHIL